MNNHLSPKKQRFVEFIKTYTRDNGYPPSYPEIMTALGFTSPGTIDWYVKSLEEDGIIERTRGFRNKRALTVIENSTENTLPLLGTITAGYPMEAFEVVERIEIPASYEHPENFALRVNGDSMIGDNIQDGDYVIIRKTNTAVMGDMVIAYINEEATLKRYYPKITGIELHPNNPNYDIIKVNPNDSFRIGGIVLGVIRRYLK